MTLDPGKSLAHYRLVEKIGEGGMGVVWKADDTKLSRRVAIKILPPDLSEDRQRLARFEREAKLLAALNHPNVAAIHGFEHAEGLHFLVLELVDGQSLAQMTKAGPLPVEEALDIARQVAEGLGAAHAAGVIHRDLKPGNVVVTPDGKAKVLDFGLAKGLEGTMSGEPGSDLSMSPTITVGGTQAGVVLGTAPYMSPEQARGKKLDKRTDIWSFGCLLYECLTGRIAFTGETVTDTLSAILQNEPDWKALPARTPPRIRYLLERCLEKSPRNRLHDVSDARIDLERSLSAKEWTTSGFVAAAEAASPRKVSTKTAVLGAILIAAVAIVGGIAGWSFKGGSGAGASSSGTIRFSFVPPPELIVSTFEISRDGKVLFMRARQRNLPEADQVPTLVSRRLDAYEVRPVQGVEGFVSSAGSPDGRWIATVRPVTPGAPNLELVKVAAGGNVPPVKIADWPSFSLNGLIWLSGGDILTMATQPYRLLRFPTDGSPPRPPVELQLGDWDGSGLLLHAPLPDGRHIIASAQEFAETGWREDLILIGVEDGTVKPIVEDAFSGVYASTGHILFSRRDKILAVPFDLNKLATAGNPVALLDGVERHHEFRYSFFDCSESGTLVYVPSHGEELERRLVVVNRDGSSEPWIEERKLYIGLSASPDGTRLAVQFQNPGNDNYEIWVSDPDRHRLRAAFAAPGEDYSDPVWSPDGRRLAYRRWGSKGKNGIYLANPDAPGDPALLKTVADATDQTTAAAFLPDGSALLLERPTGEGRELIEIPVGGDAGAGKVLLTAENSPRGTRVSRDGRWLSYASAKSGRSEIYIRAIGVDGSLGREQIVSRDGGAAPLHGPRKGDTQELFFAQGNELMAVTVTSKPELTFTDPAPVLDLDKLSVEDRTHLPDGRMIVIQSRPGSHETRRINVIVDYQDEIRRKFAEVAGTTR